METSSPWKRRRPGEHKRKKVPSYVREYQSRHCPFSKFECYETNCDPDIFTKRAALRVSNSIVSLTSYSPTDITTKLVNGVKAKEQRKEMPSGEKKQQKNRLVWASGVMVECEQMNGAFLVTILTSASLFRCDGVEPSDFKVNVHIFGGKSYEGQVLATDFHYNLAAISIQSESPIPVATLRRLDDSISVDPSEPLYLQGERSYPLRPHSDCYNIVPGEKVVAVGRYFQHPYDLMIAPGVFSVDHCDLDCNELLRANCHITKSGIGGALLNCNGEVVGITFYHQLCTPFLPINIVSKWWKHFKMYRELRCPWIGMGVTNLYAGSIEFLEEISHKFPGTKKGIIVEKVSEGSPASAAGICENDVVVQCNGQLVQSALQLFEIIFDLAGTSTEFVVMRASSGARMNLALVVGAKPYELHSWPIPSPSMKRMRKGPATRGL